MNVREEAEKRLLLEREKDEDVRRLQETLAREAEQARAEREAKVRKGHPSTLSLSVALCLSVPLYARTKEWCGPVDGDRGLAGQPRHPRSPSLIDVSPVRGGLLAEPRGGGLGGLGCASLALFRSRLSVQRRPTDGRWRSKWRLKRRRRRTLTICRRRCVFVDGGARGDGPGAGSCCACIASSCPPPAPPPPPINIHTHHAPRAQLRAQLQAVHVGTKSQLRLRAHVSLLCLVTLLRATFVPLPHAV